MTVTFTKATVADGVDGVTATWGNNLSDTLETVCGSVNRAATLVVAASNSSDADKAAADYLCDGTDDQVQINQAIDAAAALTMGGGTVQLCSGQYNVAGSILLKSYITLRGVGRSSMLVVPNATNADIDVIKSANEAAPVYHAIVSDLCIDGNKANQASGTMNALQLTDFERCWLERVLVYNMKGTGILLNTTSTVCWADSCYVIGCDGAGISLTSCGVDNIVSKCHSASNNYGIVLDTADKCSLQGNHTAGNTYGIYTEAVTNCDIIGNYCTGYSECGILLWTDSNYNNVQLNTCRKAAASPLNGLWVGHVSATGNLVTNNDLYDSGTTPYYDSGTSTNTTAGNRTT
jgi:parallel beta-helix repeat protein